MKITDKVYRNPGNGMYYYIRYNNNYVTCVREFKTIGDCFYEVASAFTKKAFEAAIRAGVFVLVFKNVKEV